MGTHTNPATISSHTTCASETFFSLLFTTQKNDVKVESIRHGTTGHPRACAVAAIRRRVEPLQQHSAPINTHLAAIFNVKRRSTMRSADITSELSDTTNIIGTQLGFIMDNISARLMRSGGAMALIMVRVETDTIHLVGRWRINAMLRFLHIKSQELTVALAARMVQYGDYALIPPAHGG